MEPANRTATLNGMITFSCEASGDSSFTILWYRKQTLKAGTYAGTIIQRLYALLEYLTIIILYYLGMESRL